MQTENNQGNGARERLLTREELAVALKVSLRTVDRMLADGEIEPIRLRGRVRFRLSEVFEDLAATARTRKRGRNAKLHTDQHGFETANQR